jgi:pentatricopeptide repeat protein
MFYGFHPWIKLPGFTQDVSRRYVVLPSHHVETHGKGVGTPENTSSFVALLKEFAKKKDLQKGIKLHARILEKGLLEKNPHVANTLMSMYSKCGFPEKALEVMESLPFRDVISWSVIIGGFIHQGQCDEAMDCYQCMLCEGIDPDAITFTCILKACATKGYIHIGEHIHREILIRDLLTKDIVLGTSLVDMYAKCGAIAKAQEMLENIHFRNVVSWSALIAGYVQQGQGHEALECLKKMQSENIAPNAVTFICILKACGITKNVEKGKEIHDEIVHKGFLERNTALGNALVDMYVKCGLLAKAHTTLEEIHIRDVVSWSTLIAGYAENAQDSLALNCLQRLQSEGLSPNVVTFVCLLKACGNIGSINKGKQIHSEIVSRGLLVKDIVLGNAIVDMYAKCGMLSKAQEVLEELQARDVVSWNALIAGYIQQGQSHKALNCFERMLMENLSPNIITFTCILKACGSIGAIEKGKQIHDEISRKGFLERDLILGNALVDMYAKCGMLSKAQKILEDLHVRDIFSWNTLISGYSVHRECQQALDCFQRMQDDGIHPNAVTFLSVLSACSHSGLLDESQTLFGNMTEKYGITPDFEHYSCMMMAYAYGGDFDKAISVIQMMPSSDSLEAWLIILGACRKWGNVKLGILAFDQAFQIDNGCATTYILMANIFTNAGMQEDAQQVEAMRIKYTNPSEDAAEI